MHYINRFLLACLSFLFVGQTLLASVAFPSNENPFPNIAADSPPFSTLGTNRITTTGNNAYWRINYSFLGSNVYVEGQATDPNGNTLVVGNTNSGNFMMLTDSIGGVTWTKTLPFSTYLLDDVALMRNGSFLVSGMSESAGSWRGFFMEVSLSGTISDATRMQLNLAFDYSFDHIEPARYGGYCLTGQRDQGFSMLPASFYTKLDENLQVEWTYYAQSRIDGMFQAADSTYWLVGTESYAVAQTVDFIHLSKTGNLLNTYISTYNLEQRTGFLPNRITSAMNCNGEIAVIIGSTMADSIGFGASRGIATAKFNTNTLSAQTISYSYYNPGSNWAKYDFMPYDLKIRPDGTALGVGIVNRTQASQSSEEQVFFKWDLSNMNLTEIIFGNGNGSVPEQNYALCNANTGAALVSEKVGGFLEMRKFQNDSTCYLGPGSYSPIRLSSGIFVSVSLAPPGTVYISPRSGHTSISVTASSLPGGGTVVCLDSCNIPVSASFTSSVVGNSVTLTSTSTPGANLNWSIPGGIPGNCFAGNTITFTPNVCGNVTVSLTATNGCNVSTVSQGLIFSGGPGSANSVPSLMSDTIVCSAGTVTLIAPSGYDDYLWGNGDTTASTIVTAPGSISILARDTTGGCYATDTITLSIGGAPISIGNDTTVCPDQSVLFDAGAGFSGYAWSNGATTQTISVSASGAYNVTITDAGGCTSSDTVNLSNFAAVNTNIGPDTSLCVGQSLTLDAGSGFSSYLWSNGGSTQTISVSSPGTYSVTVTNANGCTASDTLNLNTFAAINVNLGPNQLICSGQSATFDAGVGFSNYAWSNGSSTQTITVSVPGTYSVTVTSAAGCTGSDSASFSNFWSPPNFAGVDASFCIGDSFNLSVQPGFTSYLWSNGATTRTTTVGNPGTYTVTVTDVYGCTISDDIVISTYPPTAFSLGNDIGVPTPSSLLLSAPLGFGNYMWNTGANTSSISIFGVGVWWVQARDTNGCAVSDTIEVFLVPQPNITFAYNGMTVDFSGLPNGMASYYWTFGNGDTSTSQNPSYTYTVAGTYQVCLTITTAQGYSATTCVTVTVPGALAVVGGENYRFDVSPNPASDRLKVHVFTGSDDCLRFTLTNMLGQPVWSRELECAQEIDFDFDVQGISNGVYFLRLQGESIVDIRKIEILR